MKEIILKSLWYIYFLINVSVVILVFSAPFIYGFYNVPWSLKGWIVFPILGFIRLVQHISNEILINEGII